MPKYQSKSLTPTSAAAMVAVTKTWQLLRPKLLFVVVVVLVVVALAVVHSHL